MKKLIYTLALMLLSGIVFSQSVTDYVEVQRAALKTEKKAIVAEAMQLTDAESTVFWPLYNEYNEKLYVLNTKTFALIMKFADEYETLTDEQSIALWSESMIISKELSKLEASYFKKFQKILGGKKVLRYFQTENKIESLINFQLASEVPLAQ